MSTENRKWPELDPDLADEAIRIGSAFRSMAANRNISHEQFGRIARCIAMDTDAFLDNAIAPLVYELRKDANKKAYERARKAAWRKKRRQEALLDVEGGDVVEMEGEGEICLAPASTSHKKKRTPQGKKRLPPIVPLREKGSPLEKGIQDSIVQAIRSNSTAQPESKTKEEAKKQKAIQQVLDMGIMGVEEDLNRRPLNKTMQDLASASSAESHQTNEECASCAPKVSDVERPAQTQKKPAAASLAWVAPFFERFWKAYPKKVAKIAASKAFTKVMREQRNPDSFIDALIKSVERYKRSEQWSKDNGKFIPYPATFLNGGRWMDEIDMPATQMPSKTGAFLNLNTDEQGDLLARMGGD